MFKCIQKAILASSIYIFLPIPFVFLDSPQECSMFLTIVWDRGGQVFQEKTVITFTSPLYNVSQLKTFQSESKYQVSNAGFTLTKIYLEQRKTRNPKCVQYDVLVHHKKVLPFGLSHKGLTTWRSPLRFEMGETYVFFL